MLARFANGYRLLTMALVVPLATCLVLLPWRNSVPNTSSALLLTLVLVAVASAGDRLAGLVAAVSAALSFDFFLTEPYERFTIASAADVQTTLLLLGVGVAVSEIAYRRRRQQEIASARQGYLALVQASAKLAAEGSSSPSALIEEVAERIAQVMGLVRCRFDYGMGLGYPRLSCDGTVRWGNQIWDVDRYGLPDQKETELVVESGGVFMGRFLLEARPGTQPSRAERRVAAALASQVGGALRAYGDLRRFR